MASRTLDDLYEYLETVQKSNAADSAAQRREAAKVKQDIMRRLDSFDQGQGRQSRAQALIDLQGEKVNTMVASELFSVTIGPNCEDDPENMAKFLPLMRSNLMHKELKRSLAASNIEWLSNNGEPLDDKERSLFANVILPRAAAKGKVVDEDGARLDEDEATGSFYEMELGVRRSFLTAFFAPKSPTRSYLHTLVNSSRTMFMNNPIIDLAVEHFGPLMLPRTKNPAADLVIYKKMLTPFSEGADTVWPWMCPLVCSADKDGVQQFLYVADDGTGETEDDEADGEGPSATPPSHPFHAFQAAVVEHFSLDETTPNLTAHLVCMLRDIAKVEVPTKGHGKTKAVLAHGEISPHHLWSTGIKVALEFMKDRKRCRTNAPDILSLQASAKRAKK